MLLEPLRVLERVHGHIGWLAAASLVHPAIVLRKPGRRAHGAVIASVGLTSVTFALGLWLYGDYRLRLKRSIFTDAAAVGWLFERKEHLAFAAVAFAWAGAWAYLARWLPSPRASSGVACWNACSGSSSGSSSGSRFQGSWAHALERSAWIAFVFAALCATLVALFGTTVAAFRSF